MRGARSRSTPGASTSCPPLGACEAQAALAQAAGLLVECDVPRPFPRSGGLRRVQQVVCNLVGNAMKFTLPAGASRSPPAPKATRCGVGEDTGSGMSEADLERIFEPYWQAQRTASLGAGSG